MMKLKIRSKRSPFEIIVTSAVDTTRKLNALNQSGACKLSAPAFLREIIALDPGATMQRVKKLRKVLESNQPGLTNARATLRRTLTALRGPHFSSVPKTPDRLRWLTTDAATAELSRLTYSNVEIIAATVLIAADTTPAIFGTWDSSREIEQQRVELTTQRDKLFKRIGEEVTAADLHIDDTGAGPVSFALAPTITLAPRHNAGERLVSHRLQMQGS